jgi:hypothetical protein
MGGSDDFLPAPPRSAPGCSSAYQGQARFGQGCRESFRYIYDKDDEAAY